MFPLYFLFTNLDASFSTAKLIILVNSSRQIFYPGTFKKSEIYSIDLNMPTKCYLTALNFDSKRPKSPPTCVPSGSGLPSWMSLSSL